MIQCRAFVGFLIGSYLLVCQVQADTLRVCSQNLYNFGQQRNSPSPETHSRRVKKQGGFLVQRISEARCDVVALQEVIGETKKQARDTLSHLQQALYEETGQTFEAFVGDTRDKRIRNGFLVKKTKGKVGSVTSYARHLLPKLSRRGPGGSFSRGPLVLEFEHDGRILLVINVHFKSKFESWKDPTKTQFEALRLEMAEAVRDIAQEELAKHRKKEPVILIVGDFNSNRLSSTARVVSGELKLDDFRRDCRIAKDLTPRCQSKKLDDSRFIRLFDLRARQEPELDELYSYRFRGKGSLIDEMMISAEHIGLVTTQGSGLSIGMQGHLRKGSDHKLLWLELDWSKRR